MATAAHIVVLNIEKLREVLKVLKRYKFPESKWYELGLELGLHQPTLETIKDDGKNANECLRMCLTKWLNQTDNVPAPTWHSLGRALNEIDERAVGGNILRTMCCLASQLLQQYSDELTRIFLTPETVQLLYIEGVITEATASEVESYGCSLVGDPLIAVYTAIAEDHKKLKMFASVLEKSDQTLAKEILSSYNSIFPKSQHNKHRMHHELTELLKQAQGKLLETQRELAISNEKLARASQESNEHKKTLANSILTSEHLLQKNKELEEEKEMLAAQVDAHFKQKEEIAERNKELEEEKKILTAQVTTHYERIEEIADRNKDLEEEKEMLTAQVNVAHYKQKEDYIAEMEITQMKTALEEKTLTVTQLKQQLESAMKKAAQVDELVEKIQLRETECAIYKADFQSERNDRQRIQRTHHELTKKLEQVEGQLFEKQENFHTLEHKKVQTVLSLTKRNKELEEEKEILTAQVNVYYERGEEMRNDFKKSDDKRTDLETEITKLKEDNIELNKKIDLMVEEVERAKNQMEELESLRAQVIILEKQVADLKLDTSHQSIKQLSEDLSTTKQQLEIVYSSRERAIISYQHEKDLNDSLYQQVKELQHELNGLCLMNDKLKEANEVLSNKLKFSAPVYNTIYGTREHSDVNSLSLPHSTLSSHASNEDISPAFTQEEMERLFKPQPSHLHVIDTSHKEIAIATCIPPHTVENQSEYAVETMQHIHVSTSVQFTCGHNNNDDTCNEEYQDGEILLYCNEASFSRFSSHLDPIQEEERDRRRLKEKADKALAEAYSARPKPSIDSLKQDVPLSKAQEDADKALKELDELRKVSPRTVRKSPNRQSLDHRLSSPPIPIRHSKSSDDVEQGRGSLYCVLPEEKMKQFCNREKGKETRDVQQEIKQFSKNTTRKESSNMINEKGGIERFSSFPHNAFSESKQNYNTDFDKMTKHENEEKEVESLSIDPYTIQIDREIQEAAQWVYDQSRRPSTAEVEADSDEESTLPYDPNLICPKCGKRYHIGGIQLFKRHVTEVCPLLEK